MDVDPAFVPNTPRFVEFARGWQRQSRLPAAYDSVLVAIAGVEADRQAISVALNLAAAHGSRLKVLQILPGSAAGLQDSGPPEVGNCLDAIGRLHDATLPASPTDRRQQQRQALAQLRAKLQADFADQFPPALQATDNVMLDLRCGDFAHEVQQACTAESVDLLILSSRLTWLGLPWVPSPIRRVLAKVHTPSIVVPPEFSTARRLNYFGIR